MTANQNVIANFAPVAPASAWQTPQLLESSNDFNVYEVRTAISSKGDAIVLWEQSDGVPTGSTLKVFSRRYAAGIGWDAAFVVPGLGSLNDCKVLMDAQGTATLLNANLKTWRFNPTTGWGSPFVPPSKAAGLMSDAVINSTGDIGIVTAGADVYNIALPVNANSWLSWAQVDQSGSLTAQKASVAISANGTAMAVWQERNPGDTAYSMKAARYSNGWQAPVTIDNSFDTVNSATQPRVAMDSVGNAIAVWHQGDSIYYNVFSAASGSWGAAVEVDNNAVSAQFSANIRLVMTESGRAVALWNSGIFGLRSMQYTPGSGFSAVASVAGYGRASSLGLDSNGNATVTYIAPDKWPNPSMYGDYVYSRSLTWGGAWGSAQVMQAEDGINYDSMGGAYNGAGQGVAAWVRGDAPGVTSRMSLWVSVMR